jgi:hypothetical protein
MTIEIVNCPTESSVNLSEFLELIHQGGFDFEDYQQLEVAAKHLQMLSNDKGFLVEILNEELKSFDDLQGKNLYGPNVFVLENNEDFFVRANLWLPISKHESSIDGFKYDVLHDHNFDILTIGYLGPGYHTDLYEYDHSKVHGYLGESVDLIKKESMTLYEGRTIIFEAKKDVHVQRPPDDLSVSINLIPKNSRMRNPQFEFDVAQGKISRFLHSSTKDLIIRMLGAIGDENSLDLIASMFHKVPHPLTKVACAVAATQIHGDTGQYLIRSCNDKAFRELIKLDEAKPGNVYRRIQ